MVRAGHGPARAKPGRCGPEGAGGRGTGSAVDRRTHSGTSDRVVPVPLVASAVALGVLAIALAVLQPWLLPVLAVPAVAALVMSRRAAAGDGLQIDQMDRLRQAELALAAARSTED